MNKMTLTRTVLYLFTTALLIVQAVAGCCQDQPDSIYKDGKWFYCNQSKTDAVRVFSPKDTLRNFYFCWHYNDKNTDAWGERDIKLPYFPTKKEIISKHVPKDKNWVVSKIDVHIREVTEEELTKIYSPENLKQKQMEAYNRAAYKN